MASRYVSVMLAMFSAYVLCVGGPARSVVAETALPARVTAAVHPASAVPIQLPQATSQPTSRTTGVYGWPQQRATRGAQAPVWWYGVNGGPGDKVAVTPGEPPAPAQPAQRQDTQLRRGFYSQYAGAGTTAGPDWQSASPASPADATGQHGVGGAGGRLIPYDAQRGTRWTPPADTRYGYLGGYGASAQTANGAFPWGTPLPPGPASGARNDLWLPGTGDYFPGYLNRDGTVDRLNTRTGQYFYGVRNNQGSQDLFDARRGQWYFGFRNPDGSIDYLTPHGNWIWSTNSGGRGP
jgi:hypothetical protein